MGNRARRSACGHGRLALPGDPARRADRPDDGAGRHLRQCRVQHRPGHGAAGLVMGVGRIGRAGTGLVDLPKAEDAVRGGDGQGNESTEDGVENERIERDHRSDRAQRGPPSVASLFRRKRHRRSAYAIGHRFATPITRCDTVLWHTSRSREDVSGDHGDKPRRATMWPGPHEFLTVPRHGRDRGCSKTSARIAGTDDTARHFVNQIRVHVRC